jgi:NADPH2:quinone reductase
MKAAFIEETGPAENIRYGDLPQPEISPSQVLVRMTAVAVNPVDTYIRNGANYWELPLPFVVGCDLAGVVEAVGTEVTRFAQGTGSGVLTRGCWDARGRLPNFVPWMNAGYIRHLSKLRMKMWPLARWWE